MAVQGYSFLCFGKVLIGAKAYIKTVGSEAYVQLPTFGAVNEGCVCTCERLMEGVRCCWCMRMRIWLSLYRLF